MFSSNVVSILCLLFHGVPFYLNALQPLERFEAVVLARIRGCRFLLTLQADTDAVCSCLHASNMTKQAVESWHLQLLLARMSGHYRRDAGYL